MSSNSLLIQRLLSMMFLITVYTEAADLCVDKITNCKSYGSSACASYKDWATINCAYTCGICQGPTPVRACVDNRDDCNKYVSDICTSASWRTWADDNCAKFCGFCSPSTDAVTMPASSSKTPPPSTTEDTTAASIGSTAAGPCIDGVNFCKVYSQRACTDTLWADKYCKKFCSRC